MIPHLTAATLAAMLAATTAETHADRDGAVNIDDLLALIESWGVCQ